MTQSQKLELRVLIGLPGSGKTSYAKQLLTEGNWSRINYDDLRHADPNWVFTPKAEEAIQAFAMTEAVLALSSGKSVVVDNCNLTTKARAKWFDMAKKYGVEYTTQVIGTSLEECIARDNHRTGKARVGRPVIERMALYSRLIHFPTDKKLVLVDIDGTLADCEHRKHHISTVCSECYGEGAKRYYPDFEIMDCPVCQGTGKVKKDWDAFYKDVSNDPVIKTIAQWVDLLKPEYHVCLVSGRPIDKAGDQTIAWLEKYDIRYDHIFMRNGGDHRPDFLVKQDILNHLPKEKIAFVIDDRPQVIRMWRENKLHVYDVGNGLEF